MKKKSAESVVFVETLKLWQSEPQGFLVTSLTKALLPWMLSLDDGLL